MLQLVAALPRELVDIINLEVVNKTLNEAWQYQSQIHTPSTRGMWLQIKPYCATVWIVFLFTIHLVGLVLPWTSSASKSLMTHSAVTGDCLSQSYHSRIFLNLCKACFSSHILHFSMHLQTLGTCHFSKIVADWLQDFLLQYNEITIPILKTPIKIQSLGWLNGSCTRVDILRS